MVSLGNRRYGNPILLKADGSTTRPRRIAFTDKTFEEGWLQELIRKYPDMLPVSDIEPDFAPLVSVGREVGTASGQIDNLFLSPQGYLTIVETKLWRNPEARREVVGQIIDYAKDVNHWSFDELESRVRAYYKKFHGSELGVIDALRKAEQIAEDDESAIIDTISSNLKRGRFLLLVVGDGIRENVEDMVEFMQKTPQLYYTLALVELHVYEMDGGEGTVQLVIPHIVARTREITRAVVRIEGKAIESVSVNISTGEILDGLEGIKGEERYFSILSQRVNSDMVDFAHTITHDMENLGCKIDWKQGSFVVKLPDPGGSSQDLTLFVVRNDGKIYVGWLDDQLNRVGLPSEIDFDFVRDSAHLFLNCEVSKKYPNAWSRLISLKELEQQYTKFISLVETMINRIEQASKATT